MMEGQDDDGGCHELHFHLAARQPCYRSSLDAAKTSIHRRDRRRVAGRPQDRKSVVWGQSVAERLVHGGRRSIKKKNNFASATRLNSRVEKMIIRRTYTKT